MRARPPQRDRVSAYRSEVCTADRRLTALGVWSTALPGGFWRDNSQLRCTKYSISPCWGVHTLLTSQNDVSNRLQNTAYVAHVQHLP